jgi:hypothetical protein
VCDVDQYGAPPMDRLKGSQAGVPAAVSEAQGPATHAAMTVGSPTVMTTSKGLAAPATRPAGALVLAAR